MIISVDAQKTTLLFAFGDSYADVGNRAKRGPNLGKGWVYPYGITWPAPNGVPAPAGRYSDGKTQTDWFGKSSSENHLSSLFISTHCSQSASVACACHDHGKVVTHNGDVHNSNS